MGKHPNDRLQGTLDLLVLKSLASRGVMHGYGITLHIQSIAGDALGEALQSDLMTKPQ